MKKSFILSLTLLFLITSSIGIVHASSLTDDKEKSKKEIIENTNE